MKRDSWIETAVAALRYPLRRRRLARAGIRVEYACSTARYGTTRGSWVACPDPIAPDSVVYSFGIGRNLSFDLDLIASHAVTVHAFDPTPVALAWVRTLALPPSLVIHPYGLAAFDGVLDFHAPRKEGSAHFTPVARYRTDADARLQAPVRRLETIRKSLGHTRVDLLKIDIEGGEYDVIEDMARGETPVRQILVEFHHGYETIPLARTVNAIATLRTAGFRIFWISARSYEISLLRTAWPLR